MSNSFKKLLHLFIILLIISITSCKTSSSNLVGKHSQSGKASYYADKFEGRPTASGEPYRGNKLTAAHRTLPFGTMVQVTNTQNGKSVTVRINDRGPFSAGRIIDLSKAAAQKIDMIQLGTVHVQIKY